MVMLAWGEEWGRWMCKFHRGQRMVGVGPLLPRGGFWGQNSGNQTVHQPVQQAPSPLSHLFTSLEQFPKVPGQLFRSVFLFGFIWCVSQDRTTYTIGLRRKTTAEHFRVQDITMIYHDGNYDNLWKVMSASFYLLLNYFPHRRLCNKP